MEFCEKTIGRFDEHECQIEHDADQKSAAVPGGMAVAVMSMAGVGMMTVHDDRRGYCLTAPMTSASR